ncbi:protein tweety homolog 2 [Aplysia californica]|uniref:Protein tweety homolog n=1 Tax=Aplysia californica TaxID=6500 RepID=A0ABM0JLQ8_APLCA|nr:protein tweety homolog 2 [Aplysia californica]
MEGDGSQEKYEKIWLSNFFHSFPHWNFAFSTVNSTFDPESDDYREAAGLWGLVPIAVCFMLWLVFLIYFVFRCCQSQAQAKPRPSACPSVFTGICILIVVGLLGFGFYENEKAHRGVQNCRRAVIDANTTISLASNRVQSLDDIAEEISTKVSDDLEKAVSQLNSTALAKAIKLINHIRTEATSVRGYVDKINIEDEQGGLDDGIKLSGDIEYYRWMVNILVYCLYIFLLLLAFIGLLIKSKALLIVSAALAVIFSLFIWITTGVYLSFSVALGDLCHDPDSYFLSLAKGSAQEGAIRAYILCDDPTKPYQNEIQDALNSVSLAAKDLNDTVRLAQPFHIPGLEGPVKEMRQNLQFATGNLSTLLTDVGMCSALHDDYIDALDAACISTLSASAFLALISCVVAIACTVIIFTLSCAWRQYVKINVRAEYVPVDDSDPFLPRPPLYESDYGTMGHSTPRPWSERGTLQHGNMNAADDQVLMMTHQHPLPIDESPPPAYYPGKYIRQYADSAPSPGSVRHHPGH